MAKQTVLPPNKSEYWWVLLSDRPEPAQVDFEGSKVTGIWLTGSEDNHAIGSNPKLVERISDPSRS